MADEFWFLTDSEDERAVEDVLSQAMDHSVLEQIAAINCSSFSNSDELPSHLENRFRKLKSLPTAAAPRFPPSKSKSFTGKSGVDSVDFEQQIPDLKNCSEKPSGDLEEHEHEHSGEFEQIRDEKKASKPKFSTDVKSLLKNCSEKPFVDLEEHEHEDSGDFEQIRDEKKASKSKSSAWRSGSWSLSSPESESRSVSPARRGIGCLWCSPKKEKRKQGKENRENDFDGEFMKTFSMKEKKKIMKKAMMEEEKINREAEKIVKWAKQASARMMDVSGLVEDELDDDHFRK